MDADDVFEPLEVLVVGGQIELEGAVVARERHDAGHRPLAVEDQRAGLGILVPHGGDLAAHVAGQLLAVPGRTVRGHAGGGAAREIGPC